MKILHVIDSLSIGGAENLVCQLAIKQKDYGHDVQIVELVRPNNELLNSRLSAFGIKYFVLDERTPYNPLNIFRLFKYMKWGDVVHVHLFPALYWAAFAKLLACREKPLIYTEHSTNNKRRERKLWHALDSFSYSKYNEIVACSDIAFEAFQHYFPYSKSSFIPNGVDIDEYVNAEPYAKFDLIGVENDPILITMVANFRYPKRQDTVIKALKLLPSYCHAVFVGGGDNNSLILLSKNLNIEDRIHFLGVRSDINRILKTSDVVVMSSEYEGLSLSSIEGMAAEKPLLASNVNGLREVVQGAGELFDVNKPEELALLISKLINSKEYYKNIQSKCYLRANAYDIKSVASRYIEKYTACIK